MVLTNKMLCIMFLLLPVGCLASLQVRVMSSNTNCPNAFVAECITTGTGVLEWADLNARQAALFTATESSVGSNQTAGIFMAVLASISGNTLVSQIRVNTATLGTRILSCSDNVYPQHVNANSTHITMDLSLERSSKLMATRTGETQAGVTVRLSWLNTDQCVTGYYVEVTGTRLSNTFTFITNQQYKEVTLTPNDTCTFRVQPIADHVRGQWSDTLSFNVEATITSEILSSQSIDSGTLAIIPSSSSMSRPSTIHSNVMTFFTQEVTVSTSPAVVTTNLYIPNSSGVLTTSLLLSTTHAGHISSPTAHSSPTLATVTLLSQPGYPPDWEEYIWLVVSIVGAVLLGLVLLIVCALIVVASRKGYVDRQSTSNMATVVEHTRSYPVEHRQEEIIYDEIDSDTIPSYPLQLSTYALPDEVYDSLRLSTNSQHDHNEVLQPQNYINSLQLVYQEQYEIMNSATHLMDPPTYQNKLSTSTVEQLSPTQSQREPENSKIGSSSHHQSDTSKKNIMACSCQDFSMESNPAYDVPQHTPTVL